MKHESHTSHHIEMEPGDVAYIRLPGFEEGSKVSKTVSLRDLIQDFGGGTDVELDFSEDGILMGIEIIAL
ncbi:MAG TPA: DUF2283 domain-containing protein [Pyrinomonadaceae bacterium]|nr:DUF2283 domain-containing protein [Pyrinomonadaceae bacterium]